MSSVLTLDQIQPCFEGAIPATILTCSADGVVNITFLSHVYHIDAAHVALSAQFFNKTKKNLQENPAAMVMVMDPIDLTQYLLDVHYLHTETEGKIFDRMKQKLEDIATVTGMESIFKLRGADIYRVHSVHPVKPETAHKSPVRTPTLEQVSTILQAINKSLDMECMFEETLQGMAEHLGYNHAIIFLKDHMADRLYTVASKGFGESGVGSELVLGEGVAGTAAANCHPVRFTNLARDLTMSRAIQQGIDAQRGDTYLELNIPLPGLPQPQSVVAVPLQARGQLLGVIYIESEEIMAYSDTDVDALTSIAQNLAMALAFYQSEKHADVCVAATTNESRNPVGELILLRCYEADHSVFIGTDYVIKGVAGNILWKLLNQWRDTGQVEFTNRELRCDPDINLPEIGDNLEARLILLRKRLEERSGPIRLEKRGRGRFGLVVGQPLELRFIAREK